MALRTLAAYKRALRDGRQVYVSGERIEDVTRHPALSAAVDHSAFDYEVYDDPELRKIAVVDHGGTLISRYFQIPRDPEDLLQRNRLIDLTTERNGGVVTFIRAIGSDALLALTIVAQLVDRAAGTGYSQRVARYFQHVRQSDLSLAGAITDVKGDRSLRPAQQSDPDLYVRIVRERDDGIVVRGAKAHTTAAPYVDELVVLPTHALTAEDKDFAVAFATPVAAQGIKLIARPSLPSTASAFEHPLSVKHQHVESLTIFEDVFVPWERVFLCREWQAAGAAANYFALWHRFTGVSYKAPTGDLLIGAAQLMAEYNGVSQASHIRQKIAELIAYTTSIRAHARAAALGCRTVEGVAVPDPVTVNVGKYLFARGYHDAVRNVQDIAGGLLATAPAEADWLNPETRPWIDKYLKARADVHTEDRLRLFYLIRELVASDEAGLHQVVSLHGEGSLEAQRIAAYREYDVQRCASLVKSWIDKAKGDRHERRTPL